MKNTSKKKDHCMTNKVIKCKKNDLKKSTRKESNSVPVVEDSLYYPLDHRDITSNEIKNVLRKQIKYKSNI